MITCVSKENNLGPDDKIRFICGLNGPILFCKVHLVRTNFLYPDQMLSFYVKRHLQWHFGTLTIRSVFRNALVNDYIS